MTLPIPNKVKRLALKEELEEEEELKGTIARLKESLAELNALIVSKQDQIEKLTLSKVEQEKGTGRSGSFETTKNDSLLQSKRKPKEDSTARKYAEDLFPEEIWEMILHQITDPNDLENCSKTCLIFDKILHPLKNNWRFQLALPLFFNHLNFNGALKCRTICKDWNTTMDHFLEDHPSQRPFQKENFNPRSPTFVPHPLKKNYIYRYQFSNDEGDLRELNFLESMRDHPRNPIVGRALTVHINEYNQSNYDMDVDDYGGPVFYRPASVRFLSDATYNMSMRQQQEIFWEALYSFLEVFGKHLLHFEFKNGEIASGFLTRQSEQKIIQLLTQDLYDFVPNLRSLKYNGRVVSRAAARSVGINIARPGPHLETIEISANNSDHLTHPLLEMLVRQHQKQLRRLHIQWGTFRSVRYYVDGHDFPNLTELHISSERLDDQYGMSSDMVGIRMPQLQKLGLDWRYEPNNFLWIMDVIKGLAADSKLSVLRLAGGFQFTDMEQAPQNLYAPPTLKTLEVERLNMTSLNYVLRFPFLKNLSIKEANYYDRQRYSEVRRPEVVEIGKCLVNGDVYGSNVWRLLPRLKVFTLERDVYTRSGLELYSERKKIRASE